MSEPQVLSENQTLIDHLTELRTRLIRSAIAIFAVTIAAWFYAEEIFAIVRRPIQPYLPEGGLIFTAPMDKFMAHLKISMLAGVVVSCPFWLYQAWKFVEPGLFDRERKYGLAFIFSGSTLFLTGVSFVYFVVYPMAFDFLLNFGSEIDKPMITIGEYLSFFTVTTLVFGVAFELPLILTILGIIGVIDKKFLQAKRRYAVVILALLSAFLTPPDLISMGLMLGPMLILYELSIFLVGFFARKA